MNLLTLMLVETESGYIDFDSKEIVFNQKRVSLKELGIRDIDTVLHLTFTIAETYAEPNGKFSLYFSNAAMIDCTYVFDDVID